MIPNVSNPMAIHFTHNILAISNKKCPNLYKE